MQPEVLLELALLGETLATLGTAERPLPLVQAQVFLQVGFVPEGLAALRAREGPLPCVDNLVREETALQVVALLTLHWNRFFPHSNTGLRRSSQFPLDLSLCFGYFQGCLVEWLLWCSARSRFTTKTSLQTQQE